MTPIEWRRLNGERAIAPFRDGRRLPYTVCKIGAGENARYEAFHRPLEKFTWPKMIACNLSSWKEACALVEQAIEEAAKC